MFCVFEKQTASNPLIADVVVSAEQSETVVSIVQLLKEHLYECFAVVLVSGAEMAS